MNARYHGDCKGRLHDDTITSDMHTRHVTFSDRGRGHDRAMLLSSIYGIYNYSRVLGGAMKHLAADT